MTNRPIIGICLAILVELSHWLKIRWEFDDDARSVAWKLTTVAILLTAALIYMDSSPYLAFPKLLTWLPVLLLPMQFVQSFGMRNSMPLITFSFLAKQRHLRNIRLGLTEEMILINFGNIYFVATLLASTLGTYSNTWVFLPGIIILAAWMLFSATRRRPWALIVSFSIAGGLAIAGQRALQEFEDWLGNRGPSRSDFNPNSAPTLIGQMVTVQQSPDIVWRIRPIDGARPPRLLRKATYNAYFPGSWNMMPPNAMAFKDLDTVTFDNKPGYILEQYPGTANPQRTVRPSLPRFQLIGAATNESPLAIPGDTASLLDFELDGIEHNSMGTTRIAPKQAIIEGTVLWRGDSKTEMDPYPEEDIFVPYKERKTLDRVLSELKLDEQPTLEAKLNILQSWFVENFTYSRTLTIKSSTQVSVTPTAITQFLTTNRKGHCEYFASAAALILREAKIPTRYVTGYAVMELDRKHNEYVVRGIHGHAWCRVWDAGKNQWRDFDPTPASWSASLENLTPPLQSFNDTIKRLRENFFLWRNRPANQLGVSAVMGAIALGVIGFVFKRLWKSKRRLEEIRRANGYEGVIERTALNALEKKIEKKIGPRALGQPFGLWLTQLKPALSESANLDEALEIHQRLRFDPAPKHDADKSRLEELAKALETSLKNL